MITFKGGWSRWARVAVVVISCLLSLTSHLSIHAQRYVGGDISVLLKYEQQNATYLDKDGAAIADVLNFLKQQGWNTMRVRLFVDPSNDKDKNVCQDLEYVKTLGKRIKDAGLLFMLDFHYSDTWADPGKQIIPDSWKIWSWMPDETVYNYTKETLEALVAAGAVPDLIQTGNEISFGMLWGFNLDGKYEDWEQWGGHLEATADWRDYTDKHWDNFSKMLKAAGKACREVCPKAQIIIHTEKAGDWDVTREYYTQLRRHGVDYDIIGLSYYPMWHKSIPNLGQTLDRLAWLFPEKPVMIVETAAYYSHENDPWAKPDAYAEFYPISIEGQARFTRELVTELNSHHNVIGLFWWFPEENAYGNHVTKDWLNRGLFDNNSGEALPALKEFNKYATY